MEDKDHICCWNAYDKQGHVICDTCGRRRTMYPRKTEEKVIVQTYKGCIEKVVVCGINMPFEVEEIRSDYEGKENEESL